MIFKQEFQILCCALVLASWATVTTQAQGLNGHINPLWVESGRELLSRQGILPLSNSDGYRASGLSLNSPRSGRLLSNLRGFGTEGRDLGYYETEQRLGGARQTSLFYLDEAGQLRPVNLGGYAPPSSQQIYPGQRYYGVNTIPDRTGTYLTSQNQYYIK